MKKILFLIICLFSFCNGIRAQVYYSEYGPLSEYETSIKESDELTEVKIERRYKYFTEEKKSKYFIKNANTEEYPIIDDTDFIYTDFSEWSFNEVNDEEKLIESRKVYKYQEMDKVRYIHLTNIKGGNDVLRIAEITVMNGRIPLTYKTACSGCSMNYKDYINNGDTKENLAYIINNQTLTLDLTTEYDLNLLTLNLYLYDVTDTIKTVTISYSNNPNINQNTFSKFNLTSSYKNTTLDSIVPITYNVSKNDLINPAWGTEAVSQAYITSTLTKKVIPATQYRYKEKMYLYYDTLKTYLDDYYVTKEGYLKDELLYQDYYATRTREKIEISSLELKTKDSLEDHIKCSNTCEILGTVDYSKNGKYPITIRATNFEIKEDFTVNILENEYQKVIEDNQKETEKKLLDIKTTNNKEKELLISENNKYLKEIEKLNSKINLLNEEKEKLVKSYETSISQYQNELVRQKTEETPKKEVLKSNFASTKNIIILLIALLILIILRIASREKNN